MLAVLPSARHRAILLARKLIRRCRRGSGTGDGTVASLSVHATATGAGTRTSSLHVIICHAPALLVLLRHLVVRRIRVERDDVPGVQETGQETQTAEGDVDE